MKTFLFALFVLTSFAFGQSATIIAPSGAAYVAFAQPGQQQYTGSPYSIQQGGELFDESAVGLSPYDGTNTYDVWFYDSGYQLLSVHSGFVFDGLDHDFNAPPPEPEPTQLEVLQSIAEALQTSQDWFERLIGLILSFLISALHIRPDRA